MNWIFFNDLIILLIWYLNTYKLVFFFSFGLIDFLTSKHLILKSQFFLLQYAGIRIGPVVKKDVMKASIMLEHDSQWVAFFKRFYIKKKKGINFKTLDKNNKCFIFSEYIKKILNSFTSLMYSHSIFLFDFYLTNQFTDMPLFSHSM